MLALSEAARTDRKYGETPYEEESALFDDLKHLLGPLDRYREIFHPYDDDEEPPVIGSLADDIASVYGGATRALHIAADGSATDAAWELKFEFEVHGGRHALGAMRAIHMHRFAIIDEGPKEDHKGRADRADDL
jgi:hypothetical protein